MVWIDMVILGIVLISAFISLIRGFAREALSLVAWILALGLAWHFFRDFSVYLMEIETTSVRLGSSFFVIFISVLILGGMVNFLVGQLIDKTGLSGTDRVLGIFFGAARGAVMVCVFVLLAGLTPLPEDTWWQESQLIPHFSQLAVWLREFLPPEIADKFNYT